MSPHAALPGGPAEFAVDLSSVALRAPEDIKKEFGERGMRTTLDLDEELVEEALQQTGAPSKTAVLEMGLRALLEREARKRLKGLFGKHPELKPVKRRR